METIAYDRVMTICEMLTAAGDDWGTVAGEVAEIVAVTPGTYRRDTATLAHMVTRPLEGGDLDYRSTLYRDEDGRWHATGWSNASQSFIFRPLEPGVYFDPDAGVYGEDD